MCHQTIPLILCLLCTISMHSSCLFYFTQNGSKFAAAYDQGVHKSK